MGIIRFVSTITAFLLLTGFGNSEIDNNSDSYTELRHNMVEYQIIGRGITDKNVLKALQTIPRHHFIPKNYINQAYNDHAVPISFGQTISQPYIVAFMTELLDVNKEDKILEIGTGSGYQAAVLSELTDNVFTMEVIKELAEQASERFSRLGFAKIKTMEGDGYYGWEEEAPFDKIIVTAAAGHVPPDLINQLKPGGIIVIPIGKQFSTQYLTVIRKDTNNILTSEKVLPVRFVPFIGQAQE